MMACSLAAVSCCKDDEDEGKEYLNGTLTIEVPPFLKYGDVVHINPVGVYRNDESDTLLTYSWYNPFTGITDTLRFETDGLLPRKDFDMTVSKDEVASYTVTVSCWAEGYYIKSATVTFTVVRPGFAEGASLQGYDFLDKTGKFTDARDGREYYYASVDGRDWMIENLGWEGAGVAYRNADAMSGIFGRFYTWDEAVAACPAGWHLASDAEFSALAAAAGATVPATANSDIPGVAGALMGDISFNGSKMWSFSADVKIKNKVYFSAIPVGYALNTGAVTFKDLGNFAMFWTSDAKDADVAWARYMRVDKPDFFAGEYGKTSLRASVRCVR